MTTNGWLILGIAGVGAVIYVLRILMRLRESRKLDAQIDYGKMRKWKDED